MDYSWLSVLPPVLAIVLAIWTRQVYVSLFLGIWFGWTILSAWNPVTGLAKAVQACVGVFQDAGNTRVIIFSLFVGASIMLMQRSGGVQGFINLTLQRKLVRSRRAAFPFLCLSCLLSGDLDFINWKRYWPDEEGRVPCNE
ncbi:MAG: hypothetical protein ACE5H0_01295 [Bacteroidota bacterium]